MKPIDKYLARLNGIFNDLLNDRESANPAYWDLLSKYHSGTSGAMAIEKVFLVMYDRPSCPTCNDNAFQFFMYNFSNCLQLHKQLSQPSGLKRDEDDSQLKLTMEKHRKPVKEYLQNKKEKIIAFAKLNDCHLAINQFTNKTFDNFILETMLFVIEEKEGWKSSKALI